MLTQDFEGVEPNRGGSSGREYNRRTHAPPDFYTGLFRLYVTCRL